MKTKTADCKCEYCDSYRKADAQRVHDLLDKAILSVCDFDRAIVEEVQDPVKCSWVYVRDVDGHLVVDHTVRQLQEHLQHIQTHLNLQKNK